MKNGIGEMKIMSIANKKNGILVRLDISDIVVILQKLSPSNDEEERIANNLKYYLALRIFGTEEPE